MSTATRTADSIAAVLAQARQRLADSDSPRLDAELLLAHVLGTSRSDLYTHPDRILHRQERERFDELIGRRARREPVAYLTGMREFWSLPLAVTADTLVPRPETELLVELAVGLARAWPSPRLADLGTGSGAIAIALARELSAAHIVATDNSENALEVARTNAGHLCPGRIEFRCGDWFRPLADERFEVIVCNPPYVADADPALQDTELRFEPRGALAAGDDGLDDLRRVVGNANRHLQPGGWLVLEHGSEQAPALHRLMQAGGYAAIDTRADTAGLARITMARNPA